MLKRVSKFSKGLQKVVRRPSSMLYPTPFNSHRRSLLEPRVLRKVFVRNFNEFDDHDAAGASESKAIVAPNIPYLPEVFAVGSTRPIYPGALYPITVTDPALVSAIGSMRKGMPYVGVFLRKDEPTLPDLSPNAPKTLVDPTKVDDVSKLQEFGVFCQILKTIQQENGLVVWLRGHRRVKIVEAVGQRNPLRVKVKHIEEPKDESKLKPEDREVIAAYRLELLSTMKEIANVSAVFQEQLRFLINMDLSNPFLADCAAHLTSASPQELQEILEALDIKDRMHKSLILLKKELQISKIQHKISKGVEEKISDNQRKYMLNEQLKLIKRELGLEKDDKESLKAKYQERLQNKTVPQAVMDVIEDELNKLSVLESASMEFGVTRNYLDWLTILPWGQYTKENFDMKHAEGVLNADHYGLQDVKERILEFIAVGKILGAVPQGKIICLIGPPGVGKTSIGKSIAKALNREFYRFSVGGMHDVAEIKGHRRTYVGAMPGKLVQCLKKTQSSNPVILIDEIDKLGRGGYQGDPSSALLEVLDPEQNSAFLDHFLDVPIDLSKVLFLCTANVQDTIPGPLADRMDFIRISGYVWKEKMHIAKEYLEPVTRTKTGVTSDDVTITDDAFKALIRWYCREAGVRNLQKHVEKIYRKVALRKAKGETNPIEVTDKNLHEFVGKPVYSSDRMYDHTPVGVVNGLAWSALGGATLYIESNIADHFPPKAKKNTGGGLITTGQLGEVMKESSQIAYTVAKAVLFKKEPKNDFFLRNRIHLHVPEGATPKDGPSAGIAMVTSLLSLAMQKQVHPDIAMTGEVTLTGKVLQIGGVKEKTIAARRSMIHQLIFPRNNKKDFDELPDYIKEGLRVWFVETYEEVFEVCFGVRQGEEASPKPTLDH